MEFQMAAMVAPALPTAKALAEVLILPTAISKVVNGILSLEEFKIRLSAVLLLLPSPKDCANRSNSGYV